jgi:diguanylate cyclase (GGDEF)-like protein/PAS domain S-box-containing protein
MVMLFFNKSLTKPNSFYAMTLKNEKPHKSAAGLEDDRLFFLESGRLRFCIIALIAIFITEAVLMLLLPLLPPMPSLLTAFIDASLLVFVIFLIFRAQHKKEFQIYNSRFVESQETLRKSEERYRSLVESTEDSIYLVNRNCCYLFMNQKHLARLGHSAEEFIGRPYSDFHSEEEAKEFTSAVDQVITTGKSLQQEHKSRRDNCYFLRTLSPVKDPDGTVSAVTVVSKHFTERKAMEEELRKLSLTDELTNLYNRRGYMTLAELQIKMANRLDRELLLISADLDDLKVINDTFGHQEGDHALIDVAVILKETFRSSDIIARIGGDEFAALQMKSSENNIAVTSDRLQEAITRHNAEADRPYTLSISVGTEIYDPQEPKTLDQLMAEADKKMYEQKKTKNINRREWHLPQDDISA